MEITERQYEYALQRIEELLPIVDDSMAVDNPRVVELTMVSDVVCEYEKVHYPIAKPTVGELINLSLQERKMTQKELAQQIGISPSRVNDYINGRAEPTLKVARAICLILGIAPAAMLGL